MKTETIMRSCYPWPHFPILLLLIILQSLLFPFVATQKGSLLPFAAYLQAGESWTPLLIINGEQPEVNLTEPQKIMIVYLPNGTDVEVENNTLDFFSIIVGLLSGTRVLSNVPVAPVKWSGVPDGGNRTATVSSPLEECKILYSCMYYVVQRQAASLFLDPLTKYFKDCISAVYKHALACPLEISTVTTAWHSPCFSSTQGLTASDWKAFGVDRQLQNFLPGGPEPNGIFWTGIQMVYGDQSQTPGVVDNVWWPRKNQSFSVAVGRQMLGVDDLVCSLAVPCSPAVDCSQIGSHLALGLGATVWPCDWCLYTVAAMKNINQQLSNQYVAIKGSAIEATLRTFKIQDFFPQPNQHFGLFNALSGLAGILTFLGGFAPGLVGPALGQASNAVSSIGNFLGRSIGSPPGAQVPQETFADAVAIIYADFIKGLETVTEMLFNGSLVDGKFGIIDMMKDGAWVNVDSLQRVSDIEDQLAIEIISRSINALWKTPTSNKIFVIFQDLADDPNTMANCQADISGPPDLKYCGDGGVYYTYNYIEDGSHEGHLGWPWGANKLEEQVRIKPAVCHCF